MHSDLCKELSAKNLIEKFKTANEQTSLQFKNLIMNLAGIVKETAMLIENSEENSQEKRDLKNDAIQSVNVLKSMMSGLLDGVKSGNNVAVGVLNLALSGIYAVNGKDSTDLKNQIEAAKTDSKAASALKTTIDSEIELLGISPNIEPPTNRPHP